MQTDYVLSGGQICVINQVVVGFGNVPVPVACDTTGASAPINHNLGANEAAYAILFPELNDVIAGLGDGAGYSLHLDVRLGCQAYTGINSQGSALTNSIACGTYNGWGTSLNNGYEQIFIASTTRTPPNTNPEPGMLALMGVGMIGLAALRRRKV